MFALAISFSQIIVFGSKYAPLKARHIPDEEVAVDDPRRYRPLCGQEEQVMGIDTELFLVK